MRTLALAVLVSSFAALAEGAQVGVVPFQGLGTEPTVLDSLSAELRGRVEKRRWTVLDAEATRTRQRAAAMCGEDLECLATLGQRLEVQYLVAFGLARIGEGAMFTAMVVDVAKATKVSDYSERLPRLPEDVGPLALRAVSTMFDELSPPMKLLPENPPPPPPPFVSEPSKAHPLRPWAIGTTIGAGALAIGGGVLTVLAKQHYDGLANVPPSQRAAADSTQRTYNLAADATVLTAGLAAAAAITLFVLDGSSAPAPAPAPAATSAEAAP